MTFHVPEAFRIVTGPMGSDTSFGNNGAFLVPYTHSRVTLMIIASDGFGWEHVSASLANRCPTWDEMCFLKDTFWDGDDLVVQYHPPRSEYVNNHPYCLHMWRPVEAIVPLPPIDMVGEKDRDDPKTFGRAAYHFGRMFK